jgi:ABC-type bacteriocin/lantibiotic exporter with double-glycine peptidase domain
MILMNILNVFLTKASFNRLEKMATLKDKRIALTTDVIQGMKAIKYLSWENIFLKKINETRRPEFKCLAIYKTIDGLLLILWNFIPTMMPFVTLIWYTSQGYNISDFNVFTVKNIK